ncbi:MAG: hypothetical protein KJZ86_02775 [Caldilineaceae bacterium]|nr:hypothetical protein [Caldilineaceae bacterium]HRJ44871.1 hypothetical protein [Caldilineaceae bacterium]
MNRETGQTKRYFSYLLRLWQEEHDGQPVWRASLERSHDGERFGFASLHGLFVFLKEQAESDGTDEEVISM